METLTADPNWVVCRLKQLISIHQWRDCSFNSHSFRTKLENADDMWFHDRLFLWCCPLEAHDTVSGGAVESLLTLSIFLFFLLVFAFLFWKMLIILIWFMDLWGVFFSLISCLKYFLIPIKKEILLITVRIWWSDATFLSSLACLPHAWLHTETLRPLLQLQDLLFASGRIPLCHYILETLRLPVHTLASTRLLCSRVPPFASVSQH